MLERWIQVASILGFVALAACSSGSADESESSDQSLVAPGPGQEGGLCGGIGGFECKASLVCKYSGPAFPDAAGTCVREHPLAGHLGGLCGGIAAIPCLAGLRCKFSSGVSPAGLPGPVDTDGGAPVLGLPIPDESGICVTAGPPPGWVGMPAQE